MAKARVYYKGLSDVREITAKQLKQHGIDLSGDLVWSRSNGYALNIDLNDELESILRKEGTFTISEIKDDKTVGDDIAKASISDDSITAGTVENKETGQKSKKS